MKGRNLLFHLRLYNQHENERFFWRLSNCFYEYFENVIVFYLSIELRELVIYRYLVTPPLQLIVCICFLSLCVPLSCLLRSGAFLVASHKCPKFQLVDSKCLCLWTSLSESFLLSCERVWRKQLTMSNSIRFWDRLIQMYSLNVNPGKRRVDRFVCCADVFSRVSLIASRCG